MNIHPIPAFSDNYIWLIEHQGEAVCVDPGEADAVTAYLKQHRLSLSQIWITHHHNDHTGGIAALKQAFPECTVYGNLDIPTADINVDEGTKLSFGGNTVEVWATPGHTGTHLGYVLHFSDGLHVFCGDTLFSAGCGRVFTGTAAQLFASLQRYKSLPDETLFYPAHEYTAANLRFATHIEPDNAHIQTALDEARNIPTLPVSLARERNINPFLRTDLCEIAARVRALSGINSEDEVEIFAAMRELKNHF
ncbi:MAG: hydroxyacylglutathione hydrolase [Neisseria zoodegmatis]|uniref:hydroxyacylglutathione hydrolase n=1 Tax=Neisseria zoodegmatis TaxID=326523 RepID=UPI0026F03D45|nr:hydroxyacylglutathione hydrolase [Neisseria zoodegmatis]MDO5069360.1 hydroxyacylglutathione hydrolase [Neisseria zoodegmatis]